VAGASTTVHAGKAKDCLAGVRDAARRVHDTCGNEYGVGKKACRKGIVKRCKKLGIEVACAGATTSTTIPCADSVPSRRHRLGPNVSDPLVHVTVTARPCVDDALIEVRQASPGTPPTYVSPTCRWTNVSAAPQPAAIRCALNEQRAEADRDDTFCAEMSPPTDCFATSGDTTAVLRVRDFPPWLNIAHPFFLF